MMDAVLLARTQFAITIGFHYIFPPLTIGMSWLIVWMLGRHLKTGDELYRIMARFWIKVFALSFSVGVATGIVMEFQFGTNWAAYSRFVGDIFGAPLAAEGLFAFFLESSFLGVLLLGENRVSRRVYWFSGLMVAVGSTLSAFWIIVANSWQQTPAGFEIVDGRAQLTDFWAAVFNPSTLPRYLHAVDGALIAGAFFVMGISAWFLLRGRHVEFAGRSLKVSLSVGFLASLLALPIGHLHTVQVAETQPAKLAAFEGHWDTGANAPFLLFGIPDPETETTGYRLELPGMLSLLTGGSPDTVVTGLKDFPPEDRPPIMGTFCSFHLMVYLGMFFIALTTWGVFLAARKRLVTHRLFLRLALFSLPLPIVANELGWIAAEVGRQPWIVQGLLRTEDGISAVVPAEQILASILLFCAIYALLFFVWIFLLVRMLKKGPDTPANLDGSARPAEVTA